MRGNLTPEDIVSLIEALDTAVGDAISCCFLPDGSNRVSLVVAGSAPLMYHGWIPYTADDIDYISCSSSWVAENVLPQYHCNNRIQAFGDSWTYNYEDRLELLFEGKWMDVWTMCLEDLLFMKLGRWSPEDIQDIEAIIVSGIQIDFELLDYLVHNEEESRGAGMSDRAYSELLYAYEDFLRRVGENDWSVD